MKRPYKLIFPIIAFILIASCTAGEFPSESPITTTPAPTITTDSTPQQQPSVTSEPSPNPTAQPTDTPLPEPDKPEIVSVTLYSASEEEKKTVSNYSTARYAGNASLRIVFNKTISYGIRNYIYVNGEKVSDNAISTSGSIITVTLPESLPENYSFVIRQSTDKDAIAPKNSFNLKLVHDEQLKCTITMIDANVSEMFEPPIFITAPSQAFKFTFNMPVDRASAVFSSDMFDYTMNIKWLSDLECLVTITDLERGITRLGIDYIRGTEDVLGNVLKYDEAYSTPYFCRAGFMTISPQNLYALDMKNEIKDIIHSFMYGTVPEALSPDSSFLSIGIVYSEMEGYSYSKAFFSMEDHSIAILDGFIDDAVSDAMGHKIETRAFGLYNPGYPIELWDNEGNYHYFFGNSVFDVDPVTLNAEIELSDMEANWYPYPFFNLDDGAVAGVRPFHDNNNPLQIHIYHPAEGWLQDFQTPFYRLYGEGGWPRYAMDISDLGNSELLISGYELNEGEEYLASTYRLNLTTGNMTYVINGFSPIGYFPEAGYLIYSNLNPEDFTQRLDFISIEGKITGNLNVEKEMQIEDIVYDPDENQFYMELYDFEERIHKILIMNGTTFEVKESPITFNHDITLIGITEEGYLLAMDVLH